MDLKEKYRPQQFEHLVQGLDDPAVQAITRTIALGRLPQALCLIGAYGTGKTSIARLIGKRTACFNKDLHTFEPCGKCEGCQRVERFPDAAEHHGYIEYDAPGERTSTLISKLRHELTRGLSKFNKPRIITLDEFHRVPDQEQFVKVIEDAGDDVKFVLCVADPTAIKPAIASRCNARHLSAPTLEASIAHVERIAGTEGKTLATTDADLIVTTATRVPRDYVKILGDALSFCNGEASIPHEAVVMACDQHDRRWLNPPL